MLGTNTSILNLKTRILELNLPTQPIFIFYQPPPAQKPRKQ